MARKRKTNPFAIAHYKKEVLTKKTAKEIKKIYAESAKDIKKELRSLKMITPSDNLKKVYLENMLRRIERSSASLSRYLEGTIISASERSGHLAVDAGNKVMKNAGLEIKGAYSYVPRQEVQNIVSGRLYGNNWSLSKSIWNSRAKNKSDLERIVAKGLTENKPIKDIADDLEKYVDPSAKKPWDWSKVYPGTSAKVDYNAQRLARTMIQHSFQQSMVQSQRYNPFCSGIIWHSEMIEGRTCDLCEDRDGQVFPVNDLPLDHPNGLCYFEPALDDMDTIADRLADWVEGEPDEDIELYIENAFK